jgi:hypothetical protein
MRLHGRFLSVAVGSTCVLIAGLVLSDIGTRLQAVLMPAAQAQSVEVDSAGPIHRKGCTLRTVEGTYGGTAEGEFLPGNSLGAPAGPYRVMERVTYDGRGQLTGYGIAGSLNGEIFQDVPYPGPLPYTVNPDCTGTVTSPLGLAARFVIVDGGEEILWLNVNPGVVVSGIQKRMHK